MMFSCFIAPSVQVLVWMVDLKDCIVTCDVHPRCSGVGHNIGSLRLYHVVFTCFSVPSVGHGGGSGGLCCDVFSVLGVGHDGGSGGLCCDLRCSPVSVPQMLALMVDLEDCIVTGVHLFQCPRCWP